MHGVSLLIDNRLRDQYRTFYIGCVLMVHNTDSTSVLILIYRVILQILLHIISIGNPFGFCMQRELDLTQPDQHLLYQIHDIVVLLGDHICWNSGSTTSN